MKRGRVLNVADCCVHVTHRCHNRHFLLRFERDRRNYVSRLRETSLRFGVEVLDYTITSNHVHLLLWTPSLDDLSEAMQFLQGVSARDYNRRKVRQGAYWSDRYSPTLVQTGPHLSRCLFYIAMNMVRARAVGHPREWAACGYRELSGGRQRYRVVSLERLLWCLEMPGQVAAFRQWYERTLADLCATPYCVREPVWTESAAVGSREWVEALAGRVVVGRKSIVPVIAPPETCLGEGTPSYGLRLSQRQSEWLLRP